MQESSQRGFTLVEMMIVVAIIAILVMVLVPNFVRARAQAQTASCMMNLKEIATALELYQADNDQYPTASKQALTANDPNLLPYIKQVPVDPVAGPSAFYQYSVQNPTAGNASYSIICPGLHDPGTLAKFAPGATNGHIEYDSNGGYSAVASQ
jgi:general secretion pathway protein G